jgi:dihydrofolate reductase
VVVVFALAGSGVLVGEAGSGHLDWKGWWGDEPPYHAPVFVLTHHERAPLEMEGGTTFHFVTDGIEAALQRARGGRRAGCRNGGGAATVNQYLAAGLIDELRLHVVPVLIGAGERLLEGAPNAELELLGQPRGIALVTHLRTASFARARRGTGKAPSG